MTRLKTAARETNINLETCQITAVGSVKHFTCHRFRFMEEELHKKGDFCDAQLLTMYMLSAKGPTPNCDLSICFGRASFVDRSKNRRKENVIMKLFVWLLQRVAEMVRNLVLIVSWPTLHQSSLYFVE